ncbi:MAG TPA: bifunctional DedA family/phosphatase PAP2 family protein [Dongiaceae bacterium]|nr:bifunctional DedA family/phosphatase PAP2 family protein [Dongiaceae bacterium]
MEQFFEQAMQWLSYNMAHYIDPITHWTAQHIDLLMQWLAEHRDWILFFVALLSFLECLALVGIVVPGVVLLVGVSTAAGAAGINVWLMLLAGFIGAALGDGLSYLLGYRYHHVIRRIPPFSTHPQWIEKGERYFDEYGTMGIVLGRFIGPLRPIMPLAAGLMEMSPLRFFILDLLAGIAWAGFYLMPGYLVGKSIEGQNALGTEHLVFLLGLILVAWLGAHFVRHTQRSIHSRQNKLGLAFTLAGCLALLFLVLGLTLSTDPVQQINLATTHWMMSLRHSWLDLFFVGLTSLGYFKPMLLWAVAVTAALLLQRNFYVAGLWVGITLTAQGLMELAKRLFEVARPALVAAPPTSWSYPSGHTAMMLVFVGLLTSLMLPGVAARRHQLILSISGILILLVAGARLYLTVHWLSDIVGGLLLGGLMLAVFYVIVLRKPFHRVQPVPLLLATALAWGVNIVLFTVPDFANLLARYQLLPTH